MQQIILIKITASKETQYNNTVQCTFIFVENAIDIKNKQRYVNKFQRYFIDVKYCNLTPPSRNITNYRISLILLLDAIFEYYPFHSLQNLKYYSVDYSKNCLFILKVLVLERILIKVQLERLLYENRTK